MTAFEQWYEQYDGGHGISEQSCRDAWNAALEEAARVADSETELDGEPPKEMLARFTTDPILTMRALVQITKENISERIRALKEGG